MAFSPFAYRNLFKILVFSGLWGLGGFVFVLVEKGVIGNMQVYPSTGVEYQFINNLISIPLMTTLGGAFLMSIDVLFINKRLKQRSFVITLVIKSLLFLIILLATTILAALMATSATLGVGPLNPKVLDGVSQFFGDFAFWSIIIYAGFINVFFLFVLEVADSFGSRLFWRFFSGKYHKPKMKHRVFMFLDLKGSTALAERMGHEQYYNFMNAFIADVSTEALRSWGHIYQYVGDELVLYWPWSKRFNALQCYFATVEAIAAKQEQYILRFGVVPEFRVGIHGGEVLIGEIGLYKKDILYIGDVLNATARIEQLCREKKVGLLVSEHILSPEDQAALPEYDFIDMGESVLRGKQEAIRLFHVKRKGE